MTTKLSCDTHLNYRVGTTKGRKLGQSVITVGLDLQYRREYNFVITTRGTGPGHTYKNIRYNILKLYTSCVHLGKMTVSMNDPPHDILIKNANKIELQKFASVLDAIAKGRPLPKLKTSQPPTKIEARVLKMCISQRSEYPMNGFPKGLMNLSIKGIKLTRLPNSITCLMNLQDLDLSENSLTKTPMELSNMRLVSLSLANNSIEDVDDIFAGPLGSTIRSVNLSRNKIKRITYTFCVPKFRSIDLSYNEIIYLPPSFIGGDQLQKLNLENNNRLQYLPPDLNAKFAQMHITDCFGLFREPPAYRLAWRNQPKSLKEQSASCINANFSIRRFSGANVPRILKPLVCAMVRCRGCDKPCYPSGNRRRLKKADNLAILSITRNPSYTSTLQAEYICSLNCAKIVRRFQAS